MSSKKQYEVFSVVDLLISPLDTAIVQTNLFIKLDENELAFFKIEESLYRLHGLISVEPVIEEKDYSRLELKLSKICMIQLANMGAVNFYEKTFGINNQFKIKENMILGTLTVLSL